jgi:hypothetical protein
MTWYLALILGTLAALLAAGIAAGWSLALQAQRRRREPNPFGVSEQTREHRRRLRDQAWGGDDQ